MDLHNCCSSPPKLQTLTEAALPLKDPADMFEDIPLDTRHHTFKKQIRFPKEWYMTEERKQQLLEQRKQAMLLDEAKRSAGQLVDGQEIIQAVLAPPQKVEQKVPVGGKRLRLGR